MKKLICLAACLVFLAGPSATMSAQQRDEIFRRLMIDKLRFAQRLLEGLAMQDFAKMAESSERLLQISSQAEWFAHEGPRYKLHTNEFRRAAETIAQKAKEKNVDGAALAYLDMTMSCVRCHQHLRELREVRLPAPDDFRQVFVRD